MMLLKCYTQYVSKYGKLSSGHRTGKGQSPFQSPRRAMTENVQTTIQLHPFHMLAKLCSKVFKIGLSNMWIENFQMYKLSLEKAEEPGNKLPTFVGSWRKQNNSRKKKKRKHLFLLSLTMLKPLPVWITTNCGKFLNRWEYHTTLPISWETCIQVKK